MAPQFGERQNAQTHTRSLQHYRACLDVRFADHDLCQRLRARALVYGALQAAHFPLSVCRQHPFVYDNASLLPSALTVMQQVLGCHPLSIGSHRHSGFLLTIGSEAWRLALTPRSPEPQQSILDKTSLGGHAVGIDTSPHERNRIISAVASVIRWCCNKLAMPP